MILGLGLGSAAILPGLVQQVTFATSCATDPDRCEDPDTSGSSNINMQDDEERYDTSPSGVSQGNTSGTDNMTMSSENIPTVNVTGGDATDKYQTSDESNRDVISKLSK